MRVTVTGDQGAPLLVAVEHADRLDGDRGELADRVMAALTGWMHGTPAPLPVVEVPEPAPPAAPGEDDIRRAAYLLLDLGRSVPQVAAVLGMPRDVVRDWARGARI